MIYQDEMDILLKELQKRQQRFDATMKFLRGVNIKGAVNLADDLMKELYNENL